MLACLPNTYLITMSDSQYDRGKTPKPYLDVLDEPLQESNEVLSAPDVARDCLLQHVVREH